MPVDTAVTVDVGVVALTADPFSTDTINGIVAVIITANVAAVVE